MDLSGRSRTYYLIKICKLQFRFLSKPVRGLPMPPRPGNIKDARGQDSNLRPKVLERGVAVREFIQITIVVYFYSIQLSYLWRI